MATAACMATSGKSSALSLACFVYCKRESKQEVNIILELSKNLIKAQKLCGGLNDIILIPRIPMISKDSSFPVPFKQVQFPVLGAYYLTINRAQGETLGRAGLYLPRSVFCHGHCYVGFG